MTGGVVSEPHLEPAEVAGYAAGNLTPEARARLDRHLAVCAECVSEVVAAHRNRPRSRRALIAGLAGAALAIVAVWLLPHAPDTVPSSRNERGASDRPGELAVSSPVDGEVLADSGRFVWRSHPEAITYRVTVTDTAGTEAWSVTTSDTAVSAPEGRRLAPGRTWFWYVDALRKDGRTATSGLHRFRTGP